MITQIQLRRDTTVNWNSFNPVLSEGEIGIELVNDGSRKLKIGDGIKQWTQLNYFEGNLSYSEYLNHINNTTTAHGINNINSKIDNITSGLFTDINNHINNTANAHGIDTMKLDIDNLETNTTSLGSNFSLHINNGTSAHGINNINDKIDNANNNLNDRIDTVSGNLYNTSGTLNTVSGKYENTSGSVTNLSGAINNISGSLSGNIYNLNTVSGNLYNTSGYLNTVSGSIETQLSSHFNNIDAHGIDIIKGNITDLQNDFNTTTSGIQNDITDIKTDIENINEKIETDIYNKNEIDNKVSVINTDVQEITSAAIRNDITIQQNIISDLSMGNNKIIDVATPTNNNDAANKQYVDTKAGAIDYSTAEQDTGLKWIDGKTIYQKTIYSNVSTPWSNTALTALGTVNNLIPGALSILSCNVFYKINDANNNYSTIVCTRILNGNIYILPFHPPGAWDGNYNYFTFRYIKAS